jgi:hypothetical protein
LTEVIKPSILRVLLSKGFLIPEGPPVPDWVRFTISLSTGKISQKTKEDAYGRESRETPPKQQAKGAERAGTRTRTRTEAAAGPHAFP